jgi:hypothetical protein
MEQRCLTCTRQRMGHDTRRLLRLRRPGLRRLWTKLLRVSDTEVRQAVEAACPLGLLQKDYFRNGSGKGE